MIWEQFLHIVKDALPGSAKVRMVKKVEEIVTKKHEQVQDVMKRKGLLDGYEEMANRYARRNSKNH